MQNWFEIEQQKLDQKSVCMPNGCRLWTGGPNPEIYMSMLELEYLANFLE